MSNYRIQRVNAEIQKELTQILREVKDPRLTDMVTVTAVNVEPDLKTGKAFVSIYSPTKERKMQNLEAIKASAAFIRGALAHRIPQIRQIPRLTFHLDESLDYGERIDKLLDDINKKN